MAALTTAGLVDEHHEGDEDFSIVPQINGVERLEDQEEAAEFLRQADKIKRQIEKVEKERNLGAQCKKNGWSDWFGELDDIEKVLREHRDAEKMTLEKELLNVHHGVRRFQRQLTDVKPAPELIEKLKEIMTDVETAISTFKENERLRFEELLKEEKACSQEISAYDRKIDTWPLIARAELKAAPATALRGYRATDWDMPSEVRALESFLHKTGGLHGGWDQYDHQAFLKVWTRHAGRPALRKEAVLYLPGKSLQEVEQHEDWYRELLELQDQKREAIQRWRASRLREQHARIQGQEEVEEAERMEEAKNQAQQHREERLQAARRLEEWKLEKRSREELEEKERLAEEVHQRRRAKVELSFKWKEEERRRQLEVKLLVEEQVRLKREEEEEQERSRREELQREAEERRREATIGIKHFWGRDLHKVETKLQEKQQKEQQQVERQKRISARMKEKVEGHMGRDPSRLTRPTKGWEERMKSVESSGGGEGGRGGGYLMQISHRAIPAWRQGL